MNPFHQREESRRAGGQESRRAGGQEGRRAGGQEGAKRYAGQEHHSPIVESLGIHSSFGEKEGWVAMFLC